MKKFLILFHLFILFPYLINSVFSIYETSINVAIESNTTNLNFQVDYIKIGGYNIEGLDDKIGEVIWESQDLDPFNETYALRFADINSDGKKDEVVVATYEMVYSFYKNGSIIWNQTNIHKRALLIRILDLDENSIDDRVIIPSNSNSGNTWILNLTNGEKLSKLRKQGDWSSASTLAVGSFDGDFKKNDIIFSNYFDFSEIYNTTNLINFSFLGNFNFITSPNNIRTYDINKDGYDEIIITQNNYNPIVKVIWGNNFSTYWEKTDISKSDCGSTEITDLTNDSIPEIIYGCWEGIVIYYLNGTIYKIKTGILDSLKIREMVLIDYNNDGIKNEIVAGGEGYSFAPETIKLFDKNLTQIWSFNSANSGDWFSNILSNDINSNGKEDIIATTVEGKFYILDKNGNIINYYDLNLEINKGQINPFWKNDNNPSLDISDINSDGINDIAIASKNGFVTILQEVKCYANFNDSTSYNLTWNNQNRVWKFSKPLSPLSSLSYNITCQKGGYQTQTYSGTINNTISYQEPTPNEGSYWGGNNIIIRIKDNSYQATYINLNFNGTIYNMNYKNNGIWEIQISNLPNQTSQISFNVSSNFATLPTRTFTYFKTTTESQIPIFNLNSFFIAIIIIFIYIIPLRQKNKKAISPIIAISLIVFVAIVSITSFNSWYNTYQSNLLAKNEIRINAYNNIDINFIEKTKTTDTFLIYIKANKFNELIEFIKINNIKCNFLNTNVAIKNTNNEFKVLCNGINKDNKKSYSVVLKTKNKIIQKEFAKK